MQWSSRLSFGFFRGGFLFRIRGFSFERNLHHPFIHTGFDFHKINGVKGEIPHGVPLCRGGMVEDEVIAFAFLKLKDAVFHQEMSNEEDLCGIVFGGSVLLQNKKKLPECFVALGFGEAALLRCWAILKAFGDPEAEVGFVFHLVPAGVTDVVADGVVSVFWEIKGGGVLIEGIERAIAEEATA
jgi:hypothetical protein